MPVRKTKTCSKCGETKPFKEFHRNSAVPCGYRSACKACISTANEQVRDQVFDHYGRVCSCCGSTEKLCLDHVHGNGDEHRKLLGSNYYSNFYSWLVKHDFPRECEPGGEFELQVLCTSCNVSKGWGKHCLLHMQDLPERTLVRMAVAKTERDKRIIELQAEGLTQQQIADEVGCSQPTVSVVLRSLARMN